MSNKYAYKKMAALTRPLSPAATHHRRCDLAHKQLALQLTVVVLAAVLPTLIECSPFETQLKLLVNDDELLLQERNRAAQVEHAHRTAAAAAATDGGGGGDDDSDQFRPYRSDLKRLSYETIHRILRDENEPIFRREDNDLRYYQKRSYQPTHEVVRRSATPADRTARFLNLAALNLSEFDSASRGLVGDPTTLTEIDLHGNRLTRLNLHEFHQLQAIDLSNNTLTDLPDMATTALTAVNLNGNRIRNSAAQSNLKLRELHLSANGIANLSTLGLSSLMALETLDLSCNRITNLETSFFPQRMHNLKHLNLAHNQLGSVYRETFYNLLSLNTLLLAHNNITEIDYETFLALPNLQNLDLSYNRLKGESIRALQGIPDLIRLSIAYNPDVGALMQEFVASWSLKELDASGTGLCQIPAALAQSVRMLKLTDNWLKAINCGDLDSYPLLQYLDLSYSRIEDIEDDALGRLEILEVLFLDNNRLRKVPVSLPTSLEHLFLQQNQIMDIQVQTFQGLNSLRTLDLSGNKLLYLPALQLPKLLTLNLQSAEVRGLSQAIVHTLPHLRDLLLEDNPIKCSDLLGIAEWVSPCRVMERNPSVGGGVGDLVASSSASTVIDSPEDGAQAANADDQRGQAPHNNDDNRDDAEDDDDGKSMTSTKIDLKRNFLQMHNFYEKFKSNCCCRVDADVGGAVDVNVGVGEAGEAEGGCRRRQMTAAPACAVTLDQQAVGESAANADGASSTNSPMLLVVKKADPGLEGLVTATEAAQTFPRRDYQQTNQLAATIVVASAAPTTIIVPAVGTPATTTPTKPQKKTLQRAELANMNTLSEEISATTRTTTPATIIIAQQHATQDELRQQQQHQQGQQVTQNSAKNVDRDTPTATSAINLVPLQQQQQSKYVAIFPTTTTATATTTTPPPAAATQPAAVANRVGDIPSTSSLNYSAKLSQPEVFDATQTTQTTTTSKTTQSTTTHALLPTTISTAIKLDSNYKKTSGLLSAMETATAPAPTVTVTGYSTNSFAEKAKDYKRTATNSNGTNGQRLLPETQHKPPPTTTTTTIATIVAAVATAAAELLPTAQNILANESGDRRNAKNSPFETLLLPSSSATPTPAPTPTHPKSTPTSPHHHSALQLHIKDRHLIGTPLLMHTGENELVEATKLLPRTDASNPALSHRRTTIPSTRPTPNYTPSAIHRTDYAKTADDVATIRDDTEAERKGHDINVLASSQHHPHELHPSTAATIGSPRPTTGREDVQRAGINTSDSRRAEAIKAKTNGYNGDATNEQRLSGSPTAAITTTATAFATGNLATRTADRWAKEKEREREKGKKDEEHKKPSLIMKKMTITKMHPNLHLAAGMQQSQSNPEPQQQPYSHQQQLQYPHQQQHFTLNTPRENEAGLRRHLAPAPVTAPRHFNELKTQHNNNDRAAMSAQHKQHSTINTPLLNNDHELPHEKLMNAMNEDNRLDDEPATKTEQLLDLRKSTSRTTGHPGLVLLLSFSLFVVLLVGLMHVYRCDMPWRRHLSPHQRPHRHQQLQLHEDDAHSFLNYHHHQHQQQQQQHLQPDQQQSSPPATVRQWHHSKRIEKPFQSPLHNLQVRELQQISAVEDKAALRCQRTVNPLGSSSTEASQASSSPGSRSYTGSDILDNDTFYIEMTPNSGQPAGSLLHSDMLPMELLSVSNSNRCAGTTLYTAGSETGTGTAVSGELATASQESYMVNEDGDSAATKEQRRRRSTPSARKFGLW